LQLNGSSLTAATRARRLAELADAIESAQQLAWQLGTAERPSAEARELYGRLEAARIEVETLQGISVHTPLADPAWLEALGWSGSLLDPAD
jgi:hypothetical protein